MLKLSTLLMAGAAAVTFAAVPAQAQQKAPLSILRIIVAAVFVLPLASGSICIRRNLAHLGLAICPRWRMMPLMRRRNTWLTGLVRLNWPIACLSCCRRTASCFSAIA